MGLGNLKRNEQGNTIMFMDRAFPAREASPTPWELRPDYRRHIQDFPLFHDAIRTAINLPSNPEHGHVLMYWPFDDALLPKVKYGDPVRVSDAFALCIGEFLPNPGDIMARIQDNRFGLLRINMTVQQLMVMIRGLDKIAARLATLYPDHIPTTPLHLSASFLRKGETVEDALGRVRCKLRDPMPDSNI